MMKYIVTWIVFIAVPCKDLKPFEANCYEAKEMKKEFYDRQKAIEFHDIGNYNKPLSMTIDSIKIKEQ